VHHKQGAIAEVVTVLVEESEAVVHDGHFVGQVEQGFPSPFHLVPDPELIVEQAVEISIVFDHVVVFVGHAFIITRARRYFAP
jgi:hypothetical protein